MDDFILALLRDLPTTAVVLFVWLDTKKTLDRLIDILAEVLLENDA